MNTTFKMPEPVGHFYSDRYGYLQQADEEHSKETSPLYTVQALRDVLEQTAQIDWHTLLREDGYVTNRQASDYEDKIAEAIRTMIKEIPE